MPRQYRPREVAAIAVHLGWTYSHHKGSHSIYKRPNYSNVVIPDHNRDVRPGTLKNIIKHMGLKSRLEFDKLAQEML